MHPEELMKPDLLSEIVLVAAGVAIAVSFFMVMAVAVAAPLLHL